MSELQIYHAMGKIQATLDSEVSADAKVSRIRDIIAELELFKAADAEKSDFVPNAENG